jgi:hypothetical protein
MFHMFRSIYPLHFDVKDIHIRIHIIFHENFTQKTRSTASIHFLQGNSMAPAGIKKSGFNRHEFPEKIGTPMTENLMHARTKFFNRCS